MNNVGDMTIGEFINESMVFQYSSEYYDLVNETSDITLMEMWRESFYAFKNNNLTEDQLLRLEGMEKFSTFDESGFDKIRTIWQDKIKPALIKLFNFLLRPFKFVGAALLNVGQRVRSWDQRSRAIEIEIGKLEEAMRDPNNIEKMKDGLRVAITNIRENPDLMKDIVQKNMSVGNQLSTRLRNILTQLGADEKTISYITSLTCMTDDSFTVPALMNDNIFGDTNNVAMAVDQILGKFRDKIMFWEGPKKQEISDTQSKIDELISRIDQLFDMKGTEVTYKQLRLIAANFQNAHDSMNNTIREIEREFDKQTRSRHDNEHKDSRIGQLMKSINILTGKLNTYYGESIKELHMYVKHRETSLNVLYKFVQSFDKELAWYDAE